MNLGILQHCQKKADDLQGDDNRAELEENWNHCWFPSGLPQLVSIGRRAPHLFLCGRSKDLIATNIHRIFIDTDAYATTKTNTCKWPKALMEVVRWNSSLMSQRPESNWVPSHPIAGQYLKNQWQLLHQSWLALHTTVLHFTFSVLQDLVRDLFCVCKKNQCYAQRKQTKSFFKTLWMELECIFRWKWNIVVCPSSTWELTVFLVQLMRCRDWQRFKLVFSSTRSRAE